MHLLSITHNKMRIIKISTQTDNNNNNNIN